MYLLTAVHRNLCLRPASTISFLHLSPATHVACLSKTSAATNLFQDFQFSSTQNINCLEVTLLGAGSSTGDSQILFSQYDPIQKSWSNALRPSQRPPLPPAVAPQDWQAPGGWQQALQSVRRAAGPPALLHTTISPNTSPAVNMS